MTLPKVNFQARCPLRIPTPSSNWSHVASRTWDFECLRYVLLYSPKHLRFVYLPIMITDLGSLQLCRNKNTNRKLAREKPYLIVYSDQSSQWAFELLTRVDISWRWPHVKILTFFRHCLLVSKASKIWHRRVNNIRYRVVKFILITGMKGKSFTSEWHWSWLVANSFVVVLNVIRSSTTSLPKFDPCISREKKTYRCFAKAHLSRKGAAKFWDDSAILALHFCRLCFWTSDKNCRVLKAVAS